MKGAVFDLDGTLVDSMGAWHAADVAFLEKRGLPQEADYFAALKALHFRLAAEYTIERYGLYDETPDDLIAEWRGYVQREYDFDIQAKPGALEYLRALKDAGVKTAIATSNEPELCEGLLRRLGLDRLTDAVVYTSEAARPKGFPDVYLLAAERMGVPPEETVVFEDVLKCVRGAKDGGFRVVAVYDESSRDDWEEMRREADTAIESFSELAAGADAT